MKELDLLDKKQITLSELKNLSASELLNVAENLDIENIPTMRKGQMMFAILKEMSLEGVEISGEGVLEVVQDGFGFLRSPQANYLAGPEDIYVSPKIIRQHSCAPVIRLRAGLIRPRRWNAISPSPKSPKLILPSPTTPSIKSILTILRRCIQRSGLLWKLPTRR